MTRWSLKSSFWTEQENAELRGGLHGRKAIEFLQKFADANSSSSEGMKNIFNDDMPMASPDLGTGSSSGESSSDEKDIFGNPLSDKKSKKYSDDEVRIIPY